MSGDGLQSWRGTTSDTEQATRSHALPSATPVGDGPNTVRDAAVWRRITWVVGLGLAAYVITLIATLPARLVMGDTDIPVTWGGTVWHGEAGLAGGHRLRWDLDPLSSLFSLGFAADWTLQGQGTDLSGSATLSSHRLTLTDAAGLVSWPLVRALSGGKLAACDLAARVELESLRLGDGVQSAAGALRTGPASCVFDEQGAQRIVQVPALEAATVNTGELSTIRLTEASDPTRLWADLTLLADRRLAITWYEPALALVSDQPANGPVMLEFGF